MSRTLLLALTVLGLLQAGCASSDFRVPHRVRSMSVARTGEKIAFTTDFTLEPTLSFLWLSDGRTRPPRISGFHSPNEPALVAFAPVGSLLAVALRSGAITVLDGQNKPIHRFKVGPDGLGAAAPTSAKLKVKVGDLAWVPDGRWVAVSVTRQVWKDKVHTSDRRAAQIRLFSLEGKPERRFDAGRGQAPLIAFSPDGATLVSVGDDAKIRAWSVATGKLVWETKCTWSVVRAQMGAIAFAPDGGSVYVTGAAGPTFEGGARLASYDTRGQLRWLIKLPGAGVGLGFVRNGHGLAVLHESTPDGGGTVTGGLLFVAPENGATLESLDLNGDPRALGILPGGQRVVVAYRYLVGVRDVPPLDRG